MVNTIWFVWALGASYETVVTTHSASEAVVPRSVQGQDHASWELRQPRTTAEVLEESTGVVLQRTNRGAATAILRGLVGPQNLLVLDGLRFSTSTFRTGPSQYMELWPVPALQRIDVLRGPSSVFFGSGAMGGVIAGRTRQAVPGVDWTAGGAVWGQTSDWGRGASVHVQGGTQRLGVAAGVAVGQHDDLRIGGGAKEPLSGYERTGWFLKLRYEDSPQHALTFSYLGALVLNAGRTDRLGRGDIRIYDNQDHFAYLRWERLFDGPLKQVRLTGMTHYLGENVERFRCAATGGVVDDLDGCVDTQASQLTRRRRNDDDVTVYGLTGDVQFALGDFVDLYSGAELYLDSVQSEAFEGDAASDFSLATPIRGNFSPGSNFRTLGAFVLARSEIEHNAWTFGGRAGARFSNLAAYAPDVPDIGEVNYNFSGVVGAAGVWVAYDETWTGFLNFNQGFRAPNLQETTLLGDTGNSFEIPNPDLQPERSNTLEAGLRFKKPYGRAEVVWFSSWLSDVIDESAGTFQGNAQVDGKDVRIRTNGTSGFIAGFEGRVSGKWGPFYGGGSVLYLYKGEVRTADGVTPIRRHPPPQGFLRVGSRFEWGFVELGARGALRADKLHPGDISDLRICQTRRHSGQTFEQVGGTCRGTPGYAVLDARSGFWLADDLLLLVAVENVTDNRYKSHGSGVFAPGVGGRVTLRLGH